MVTAEGLGESQGSRRPCTRLQNHSFSTSGLVSTANRWSIAASVEKYLQLSVLTMAAANFKTSGLRNGPESYAAYYAGSRLFGFQELHRPRPHEAI